VTNSGGRQGIPRCVALPFRKLASGTLIRFHASYSQQKSVSQLPSLPVNLCATAVRVRRCHSSLPSQLCDEPGVGPANDWRSRCARRNNDRRRNTFSHPLRSLGARSVSRHRSGLRYSQFHSTAKTTAAPDTAPGYRVERSCRRAPSGATEQECAVYRTAAFGDVLLAASAESTLRPMLLAT